MNRPTRFSAALNAPEKGAEDALWQAFKQDASVNAREQLFALYMPLARSAARRLHQARSYGDIDITDIRQLAYAGLLDALDRYDPGRQVPFHVFASHRIKGSILDGLEHMNEMREQLSWRRKLTHERIRSLATDTSDGMSTPTAMAALADLAVGLALGFMLEGTGMMTTDEEGRQPARTAYDSATWRELSERLIAELIALPERERLILQHHYMEDVSFGHLARLLNLSKARISQLHRSALEILRKRMVTRGHFTMER